jgi:F-type H+-transporting ATPase subunit epsilon
MPEISALSFHIEIVTPERVVHSSTAQYAAVPGIEGDIGVLEGHIPLLTLIAPGEVRIITDNKPSLFAVGGGILEINDNTVTIAAETAEAAFEIDINKAIQKREQAKEQLAKATQPFEVEAIQKRLQREEARIKTAQHAAAQTDTGAHANRQ